MTGRERFRRLMNLEPVDRLPLLELENYEGAAVDRWRTEGLPPDASVVDFLGLDTVDTFAVNYWPVPGLPRETIDETDEYLTIRDELGILTRISKALPGVVYAHLDHPIKTRRDWEALRDRLDPHDPARYPADWGPDLIAGYNNSDRPVGLIVHPFFNRLGYYMMGTENFLVAFHDDPGLMRDIFDFWSEFVIAATEQALRAIRFDYVAIAEDIAFKHSSLISPAMYREFWMPRQTPVLRLLQEFDIPVLGLWSSGDLRPILPMAIEAGFNATWPIEAQVGLNVLDLRRDYGRRLLLAGNIAIAALIKGKDAIRHEVETKVVPLVKQGGYLPTVDDITPPEVPFENYVYYVSLLRQVDCS
jgi:uroporphyrinogen decarboxylase